MDQNILSQTEESKREEKLNNREVTLPKSGDEEKAKQASSDDEKPEIRYFQCSTCSLREKYEYFGKSPPFVKEYKFEEDAYVIEDPFLPPNRGEFIVLGAHCVKCNKVICKDSNCSFYFDGTYCIRCAKAISREFPNPVQEKLNRIVIPI